MDSTEMLRPCSGKSQEETREKDFFLRRVGRDCWRTSGRGGGGVSSSSRALNVADASEKLFARTGMWTVGLAGAVRGRARRSSSDVLRSGMGSGTVKQGRQWDDLND